MTELMRRRRALMAVGGGESSNIIWEWSPSKGLPNLSITNARSTTLTSEYLRVYTQANMGFCIINPTETITYSEAYKIIIDFGEINGNDINLYITSRGDSQRNNSAFIKASTSQLTVRGASSNVSNIAFPASGGTLSLTVDKKNQTITGELNGATYGPYAIATGTSSTVYIVGLEGSSVGFYADIKRIAVEAL